MSRDLGRRLAWTLWALVVVLTIAAAAFETALASSTPLLVFNLFAMFVQGLSLPTVGAAIVSRRPGNRVGWICCAAGFAWAIQVVTESYLKYSFSPDGGALPGLGWMGWLNQLAFEWTITLLGIFLLLLFPTGLPPGRSWGAVGWIGAVGVGLRDIGTTFEPLTHTDYGAVPNPIGIERAGPLLTAFIGIGSVLLVLGVLGAVASLAARWRRALGIERQQLKWFGFAGSIVGVTVVLAVATSLIPATRGDQISQVFWLAGFVAITLGLPAAIGLAILRHDLYDIDRIINRALVYGTLTAGLAGLYAGGVVLLQGVFDPLTRGSHLAVAGTTLVVAALARPARERIQRRVDRRFYRHKYDATTTLDTFSRRLREQVDLDTLTAELCDVVGDVMQPTFVSLWLPPWHAAIGHRTPHDGE